MLFKKKKEETEKEIATQEQQWEEEKNLIQRKNKIKAERKQLKSKKKMTTTKLLMAFLIGNCSIIEIFTGWCTYQSLVISRELGTYVDFSPLVTLIGAVVGEVIGFAVYAYKAMKENTEGGITYMQAQHEIGSSEEEEEGVG